MTVLPARFTQEREVDTHLPLWLARHNKHIFGPLFGVGVLFSFVSGFR